MPDTAQIVEDAPSLSLEAMRQVFATSASAAPPSRLSGFPDAILAWLGMAPSLPLRFAECGIPDPGGTGMIQGKDAASLLDKMTEAGACTATGGAGMESFTMSEGQREDARRYLIESRQRDPAWFAAECQRAANWLRKSSGELLDAVRDGSDIESFLATLPNEILQWCSLAAANAYERPRVLRSAVRGEISAARECGLDSAPEAVRWIELAKLLARWLPGELELPIAVARTRIEIYHRERTDLRWLANYFPRRDAEAALDEFIRGSGSPWALHFLGRGGMGKTMLLRHLTARLAPSLKLATVRVDFDHVHPDFPTLQPGLLLRAFAEHLRARSETERAFDSFDEEDTYLTELAQRGECVDINSVAFGQMLGAFSDGLRKVIEHGLRPVLILDTCEELVKLRLNGKLPPNVEATFAILARLHAAVPEIRVIFAGRRPLIREGESLPIKKEDMRVIEIAGFDRGEAGPFLEQYKLIDGERVNTVPAPLYEAIIGASSSGGGRCNPFEIDLLAKWAATDPTLTQEKLATGGHAYARERIIERLPGQLVPHTPKLVLMGRFDSEVLGTLLPRGVAEEFTRMEWIDRKDGFKGRDVWELDRTVRAKLLAYYRDDMPRALGDAARFLIEKLTPLTLETGFAELAPEMAVALLDTFTEAQDWPGAALWWARLEARIAQHAQWEWAERLTEFTLAARDSDRGDDEAVAAHPIAAAMYATRAAVLRHRTDAGPASLREAWEAVRANFARMPEGSWLDLLRCRVNVGMLAANAALGDVLNSGGWKFELTKHGGAQAAASTLAAAEAMLEVVESGEAISELVRPAVCATVRGLADTARRAAGDDVPPAQGAVFTAWRACLELRCRGLEGSGLPNIDPFLSLATAIENDATQCWLDWAAPEDFPSRLRLEAARLCLVCDVAAAPSDLFIRRADAPTAENIDQERLLSACLQIEQARGPRAAPENSLSAWLRSLPDDGGENLRAFEEMAFHPPACAAHRRIAPFAVAAWEAIAMDGFVGRGLRGLRLLANRAVSSSTHSATHVELQTAAECAQARVGIAYRLGDPGGRLGVSAVSQDGGLAELRAIMQLVMEGRDDVGTALSEVRPSPAGNREFIAALLGTPPVPENGEQQGAEGFAQFLTKLAAAMQKRTPAKSQKLLDDLSALPIDQAMTAAQSLLVGLWTHKRKCAVARTGTRQAGRLAEREAAIAAALGWTAIAREFYDRARVWCDAADDLAGALRAEIGAALANARLGDEEALRASLGRGVVFNHRLRTAAPALPVLPFEDMTKETVLAGALPEWYPLGERVELCEKIVRRPDAQTWASIWLRVRGALAGNRPLPPELRFEDAKILWTPLSTDQMQRQPDEMKRQLDESQRLLGPKRTFSDASGVVGGSSIIVPALAMIYLLVSGVTFVLSTLTTHFPKWAETSGGIIILAVCSNRVIQALSARLVTTWKNVGLMAAGLMGGYGLSLLGRWLARGLASLSETTVATVVITTMLAVPVIVGLIDAIRFRSRAGMVAGLLFTSIVGAGTLLAYWLGVFSKWAYSPLVVISDPWLAFTFITPLVLLVFAIARTVPPLTIGLLRVSERNLIAGFRIESATTALQPSEFHVRISHFIRARREASALWRLLIFISMRVSWLAAMKAKATFARTGSYVSLGDGLPARYRFKPAIVEKLFGGPVPRIIEIPGSPELHSVPWEAIFNLHSGVMDPSASPIRFRRTVADTEVAPLRIPRSAAVLGVDSMLSEITQIAITSFRSNGMTATAADSAEGLEQAGILLIFGDPIRTSRGVELRAARRTIRRDRGVFTLTAADITPRGRSLGRLVFLSALPREADDFSQRTDSERDDAGLLRIFAAEMAGAGAAVIVFPSQSHELLREQIEALCARIPRSTDDLLMLARDAQARILGKGPYASPGDNAELAFDVCSFLPDEIETITPPNP